MSAAEIANMFDALRDMVVSALVAEQDQRSLLLQRQQEQDVLIVELQQRIQCLEQALSDTASEFQLVRQQLLQQEQQDKAADAAEWKTLRATLAKCLRAAWYGKAAEKEQKELPHGPMELKATLLTGHALKPEVSLPWKHEDAVENVSETHELPKKPLEVNPTLRTGHLQNAEAHGQEDSQDGWTPEPPAVRRTWKCVRRGGMDVRRYPQISHQHTVGYLHNNEVFEVVEERPFRDASEGVFLRLAKSQGWVFSQSRSGTFCVHVDDSWESRNAEDRSDLKKTNHEGHWSWWQRSEKSDWSWSSWAAGKPEDQQSRAPWGMADHSNRASTDWRY